MSSEPTTSTLDVASIFDNKLRVKPFPKPGGNPFTLLCTFHINVIL